MKFCFLAYSVEKPPFFENSTDLRELNVSNPLFLLDDVSAGTPEDRENRVFQHNRPEAEIHRF